MTRPQTLLQESEGGGSFLNATLSFIIDNSIVAEHTSQIAKLVSDLVEKGEVCIMVQWIVGKLAPGKLLRETCLMDFRHK